MSGLLYQLRDDFKDALRLVRANAVSNYGTVLNFGVRGTPTVILFHGGKQRARWSGSIRVEELYDLLDRLLPAAPEG